MVVPEYQDGKSDDSLIKFQKVAAVVSNTRQAGGQQDGAGDEGIVPKIIVDIREFRSDLPCLIHRRGIEVVPVTITVNSNKLQSKCLRYEIYPLFCPPPLHL